MAGEMLWSTQSGYLTNNKLNKSFQKDAQPLLRFQQFTKYKEAFGKQMGQSVNWLKVANISNYGGKLAETQTMHETKQVLTWGTLTVTEYGNSIPFTGKIQALSEYDIKEIVRDGLLDDSVKCIDGEIEQQFNACGLRYCATGTAAANVCTDGTATGNNNSAFNTYHLRAMVDELKKRNVPGWSDLGGDYVMICSLECLSNLMADLESINQHTETGYKKLLNGEQGRYHGVRFVEDTFATRYTYSSTARTATAKSWTNAKSLDGYMFGSPTVREAIVIPPEIRAKVVTDYGRSHGLAWYSLGGWKIERLASEPAQSRIIKWDSAA